MEPRRENTERYDAEDMRMAVETLRKGGVILYPTDTIWGIGCDATNEAAVKRIYDIKHRADSKSMLVLLDSAAKLPAYVDEIPDMAWELIDLTTKPLTIIYPQGKNMATSLLAADGSVGIRITEEKFSKDLCTKLRKPLVSTSANISGMPSALNFSEITQEIKDAVDYVVGYRQTDVQRPQPSSIIKLDKGNVITIIRQ